jgi:hypothetical protein
VDIGLAFGTIKEPRDLCMLYSSATSSLVSNVFATIAGECGKEHTRSHPAWIVATTATHPIDEGWAETVLYFTGGTDGGYRSPDSPIFGGEHRLYGTTFVSGSYLYGTVFELISNA